MWVSHTQKVHVFDFNATFPFPQVFSLSPFPPYKGTHGDRVAGGTTLSTRIDRCLSLIMPPRFLRRLRNNTAQSLVLIVKLGVRFARRRCGSCSVFEVTHSVYKCAPNRRSFRAQSKNFVIASLRGNLVESKHQLFLRPHHNYLLLIIHY